MFNFSLNLHLRIILVVSVEAGVRLLIYQHIFHPFYRKSMRYGTVIAIIPMQFFTAAIAGFLY